MQSQKEFNDELRVKRYIRDYEIQELKNTIGVDKTEEDFNEILNSIAEVRERQQMNIYLTVEELYKKLGEIIFAGHGKDFVNIKSEDMDYLADKSFVNDIKIGEDYTIEINV